MTFPSILSLGSAVIALILAGIGLIQGGSNLTLQSDLQRRTQEIQTEQQELQIKRDKLQQQKQQVDTAQQLAQQLGPQVINSLKIVGMRSENAKIFTLLAKYGVQVTDQEKEQIKKLLEDAAKGKEGATPAPAQ